NKINETIKGVINTTARCTAILITDIAPTDEETAELLEKEHQLGRSIVLIDHHMTRSVLNKYEWAVIEDVLVERTSATELFWHYLHKNVQFDKDSDKQFHLINAALIEHVCAVTSYDTWAWKTKNDMQAKGLNDLLYIIGSKRFVEGRVERLRKIIETDSFEVGFFTDTDRLLLELEAEKEKAYIDAAEKRMERMHFVYDGKALQVGVVFAEAFTSSLGNDLAERNPDLDFILIGNAKSNTFSLRTIHDHVDVSDIAKAYAGGGHPKASGMPMLDGSMKNVVLQTLSPVQFT
ncbi:MAG: hypothetical protein ACRC5C_14660, partial [Bacilli bacterium]